MSAPQRLPLRPLLSDSLRCLYRRPTAHLSLGAAIVVSLLSVFCLLGLLSTPFFVSELFSMQLWLVRGRAQRQPGRRWLALLVLAIAVLLFASVISVGLLSGSPRVDSLVTQVTVTDMLLSTGALYGLLSGLLVLLFIVPFMFTPLILLEQPRATLLSALLDSAALVGWGGYLRHLLLSAASHAVQLSPAVLALLFLWLGSDVATPRLLLFLPLLAVTLPLGQGMIVSAYHRQTDPARRAPAASADPGRVRTGALRAPSVALWTLVLACPLVTCLLLVLTVLAPSQLRAGEAVGDPLGQAQPNGHGAVLYPPATALTVFVGAQHVSVVASDGGGAGPLPLPTTDPVTGVRLLRVGQAFGIEVAQGANLSHTLIDAAGVRLDDSWTDRLLARTTLPHLFGIYLCLWIIGLVAGPVLTHLSRDGWMGMAVAEGGVQRAGRRALWVGAALSLPALWALHSAATALLSTR